MIVPPAALESGIKPKKSPVKKPSAASDARYQGCSQKKGQGQAGSQRSAFRDAPPIKDRLKNSLPLKVAVSPEKFGISIKHRVPGRTRLKLRQMKYNEPFARRLEERLAIVPGIIAVETSTITGRVVLYYNPGNRLSTVGFHGIAGSLAGPVPRDADGKADYRNDLPTIALAGHGAAGM